MCSPRSHPGEWLLCSNSLLGPQSPQVSLKLMEQSLLGEERSWHWGAELDLKIGQTISKRGTRRGESVVLLLREWWYQSQNGCVCRETWFGEKGDEFSFGFVDVRHI